jgi:hypothetical protein
MMSHDPHQRYAIVPLQAGPAPPEALVVGGLDDVMSYLPQTVAREKREREADNLAMQALKTVADANLRADAVIAHEREVKAREDAARAIMSDAIHRFAEDVLELGHRVDAFEQRKIADAIATLPDSDDPEGRSKAEQQAEADNLPPAPLPPPHGDEQEVETVLERERGDQGDLPEKLQRGAPAPLGSYPTLGREPPQVPQPTAVSLNTADDATPAFVCGRDRRAWKRQQRNQTWRR